MRARYLIPMLLLLATTVVGGPIDPNPNGIGIYADLQGRVNRVDMNVGEPMEVYVLVTRLDGGGPEDSQFAGAEFRVEVPSNVELWGWNIPLAGALVATDPPEFAFALQHHVPYTEVIHVMTLIIVPLNNRPARFYLTATDSPSLGDVPCYMDSHGFELYELHPYPGGCENQVFVINGEIVPGEATSWSEVKALYQ